MTALPANPGPDVPRPREGGREREREEGREGGRERERERDKRDSVKRLLVDQCCIHNITMDDMPSQLTRKPRSRCATTWRGRREGERQRRENEQRGGGESTPKAC